MQECGHVCTPSPLKELMNKKILNAENSTHIFILNVDSLVGSFEGKSMWLRQSTAGPGCQTQDAQFARAVWKGMFENKTYNNI